MTSAWLVYRIEDGKVRVLGLYKSKDAAQIDVERMGDDDWEIVEAMFIGWGINTTN